jgi:hypothetical protein
LRQTQTLVNNNSQAAIKYLALLHKPQLVVGRVAEAS